jgi:hypothetical protein
VSDLDALRLALPGVAKCQPLSFEDVETIAKKAELRDLIARLGFSKRRAAKACKVDESTLRGWLRPLSLDRKPREEALERLRDLVEAHALRERASKLEAV